MTANEGAFLDLDGPLGQRRIDWRFDDLLHFDHRKIVVIDGRVAFVGGPGIEDHYANEEFHDLMVRLEGPVVAPVQAAFLLSWHFQGGPLPVEPAALDRFFPELPTGDGLDVEILMNDPGEGWRPIEPAFREAVSGAQRRLYVVNPYLADRTILRGLVAAGKRGVDVRVIVPGGPAVAARERGRCATGSGRCSRPASTSASTSRWPTRSACCRTTRCSSERRTSMP